MLDREIIDKMTDEELLEYIKNENIEPEYTIMNFTAYDPKKKDMTIIRFRINTKDLKKETEEERINRQSVALLEMAGKLYFDSKKKGKKITKYGQNPHMDVLIELVRAMPVVN